MRITRAQAAMKQATLERALENSQAGATQTFGNLSINDTTTSSDRQDLPNTPSESSTLFEGESPETVIGSEVNHQAEKEVEDNGSHKLALSTERAKEILKPRVFLRLKLPAQDLSKFISEINDEETSDESDREKDDATCPISTSPTLSLSPYTSTIIHERQISSFTVTGSVTAERIPNRRSGNRRANNYRIHETVPEQIIEGHSYIIQEDEDSDYEAESENTANASTSPTTRAVRYSGKHEEVQTIKTKRRTRTVAKKIASILQPDFDTATHDSPANAIAGKIRGFRRKDTSTVSTAFEIELRVPKQSKRKTNKEFGATKGKMIWDWTPFPDHKAPSDEQCETVFAILKQYLDEQDGERHMKIERDPNAFRVAIHDGASPAPKSKKITVDNLFKTVLAIATDNKLAISQHNCMREAYPFLVDGKEVIGTMPNWHDIRTGDMETLQGIIECGGLNKGKSKYIKNILDIIYQRNSEMAPPDSILAITNEPGAADFVPGALSIDYLRDLSKEKLYEYLIGLPGIGMKTASCILLFNYNFPVSPVDTHVFRLAWLLGWIPEELKNKTDRHWACMHLDFHIPEDLKHAIHQGFWKIGQICHRCSAKANEHSKDWEACDCPLKDLIIRRLPPKALRDRKRSRNSDEEDIPSPQKKKSRQQKPIRVAHSKLTAEEAAAQGYVYREDIIDEDFGETKTRNIIKSTYWLKKN